MQIQWQEIMDRARVYLDDDHNDRKGFIAPDKLLKIAAVEYRQLRHRWIRSGLIGPEPIDQEFTGPEVALSGVHGIMGVIKANELQFAGGTFDLSTLFPSWLVVLRATGSSARCRLKVQYITAPPAPGADLVTLSESGSDTTLEVHDGAVTSDLTAALAASTLFSYTDNTGEETASGAVGAGPSAVWHDFVGGDIRVTGDWYELRSSQLTRVTKDWRTFDSSREANEWEAFGEGDSLRLRVYPEDSNGTYIVRYFATVADPTDPNTYVEVPDGGDERLVLGVVRRAAVKASETSTTVKELIIDADAQLNFAAARKGGGLRMRDAKLRTHGFWSRYSLDWWFFRT